MRTPWFNVGNIPVSGTAWCKGSIPLVRARTLSITIQVYFAASHDTDATVYVYYSPDGNNWDTIAYTTWVLGFSAAATVQRTVILDVPEHGYIMYKLVNGSDTYTMSKLKSWYTIQSWDEIGTEVLERALTRALEKQKQEETGQV